ncbi:MAG: Unknown protein [uncultured Sulfurovum sp.]|uniref:DUF4153 domain-containing protein n=1 Tax=uncultured Sulfurovum sp. TaxID=269237 RepID=A0A6S6TIT3_9BACT|nr:MAG: Unknown protein [uncultured Sulfurovum sp.]
MNFVFTTIDQWSLKILEIFKRFPLAMLSSFIATILLLILIEIGKQAPVDFLLVANKLAMVLSLGIFLFPALHLLSKKIWFKLVGIGLLAFYYYYLPFNILNSNTVIQHMLLVFALSFMFLWAPFMDVKISNQNIWEWTQKIIQNLLVGLLLSLVIFIMFYVSMYALEELFFVTLATRHYVQFALFLLGIFSTGYFLGKIPKYIMLVQKNKYDDLGLVFTKFMLTPALLIYFLLIFAYIIKIILEQSWLSINIDLLAVGYTFVAIGTYMHWTPLWDDANQKFRLFIWGSTLMLSITLGVSIYFRILDSSLDEHYLISLFTLWLGLISLYFLFIKEASYKWLFFSISLLILISQSQQLIDVSLELYTRILPFL